MKTEPNIPYKPRAGVYGDDEVYKAYSELYNGIHEFMDDVNDDCSHGALGLGEVASRTRARSQQLILKAKNLDVIIKGICYGRK